MPNNMLAATERSRPILQYVRELETMVRQYRAIQTKFKVRSFALGFGAGAAVMLFALFLMRHWGRV